MDSAYMRADAVMCDMCERNVYNNTLLTEHTVVALIPHKPEIENQRRERNLS